MKATLYNDKEEWLEGRRGTCGGSRLKDLVVKRGTEEKMAFYEIIAERIAESADDESPLDRGVRLEEEAIMLFEEQTDNKVDKGLYIWEHDTIKGITVSPDGVINDEKAVEVKCLSSAMHIKSYIQKKVPDEYYYQTLQYFIVNEKLETLYFVLYDPRMPEKLRLHYFTLTREDLADDIQTYFDYQKDKLKLIDDIVTELTF